MHFSKLLLTFALGLVAVASSSAVPITFTFTGTGAGTIGGSPFASSAFTITAQGDTTDRQALGPGIFSILHASASINISGLGLYTISAPTRTFINDNNDTVGFSRAGSSTSDLFNGASIPALNGWAMLTSIGPVSGSFELLQWGGAAVTTSGGQLVFNNGFAPGTFEAVLGTPSRVSEASNSLVLSGFAVLVLGFLRRKL